MERLGRAKPLILFSLAGLLYGAAAPGCGVGVAVFIFMVPVFHGLAGLTRRNAALLGALQWIVAYVVIMRWLPAALSLTFNWSLPLAAAVALVLVSVCYGLFGALVGWCAAWCHERARRWLDGAPDAGVAGPAALAAGLPLAFAAAEWLRAAVSPVLGMAGAASCLTARPALLSLVPWVGEVGMGALIMAVNAAVYFTLAGLAGLAQHRPAATAPQGPILHRRAALTAALGLSVIGAAALATAVAWSWQPVVDRGSVVADLAVVQASLPARMKWNEAYHHEITERYVKLTEGCAPGAQLLLWPETALNYYPQLGGAHLARVRELARRRGALILAGGPEFVRRGDDQLYYNAVFAITGDRVATVYRKERLFPFTEYCPVPLLLPWYRSVFGMTQFTPAPAPGPVTIGGRRIGIAICFESTMPGLMARRARGADVIVVFSDDVWLGGPAGAALHHAATVLRAVENRRWAVHAVNAGIPAFISPRGESVRALPWGVAGCLPPAP